MAIELTDEMRDAVHIEDCARDGHVPNVSKMFGNSDTFTLSVDVLGPDDGTLPYVYCTRCFYVWLVMPEPSRNYQEAIAKLRALLKDVESIKPKRRRSSPHP